MRNKTLKRVSAIALLTFFCSGVSYAADTPLLFTDSPSLKSGMTLREDLSRVEKRKRFTGIDFSLLLKPSALPKGKSLILQESGAKPDENPKEQANRFELNLFDDANYILVLERAVNESPDGSTITWYGSIEGEEGSRVILVSSDGIVSGNITIGQDLMYQIRYKGDGVHVIREIDQGRYGKEIEPVDPVEPVVDEESGQTMDSGSSLMDSTDLDSDPSEYDETGTVIDVMIVYTPAARIANGGTAGMESLIDLAVAETNTGYSNSAVVQRVNLVHREEVAYTESTPPNSSSTIVFDDGLDDLQGTSDGEIDNVHQLRNDYAADIVSLFVHDPTTDWCGKGNIMNTESHSFESSAFNVVDWDCATGYYSYAHEMGHNMGSRHDRPHDSSDGAFSYSHGYQDPEEDFRTIMSYNCPTGCTRVNYWSNVNVDYISGGTNYGPTGVLYSATNSAANWRSLNYTRDTVANWRPRFVYVNDAYIGTETGLSANPFNTISEGVNQIGKYATDPRLYIAPGTYTGNEPITITKPMNIYNWGTGSIVIE
ncbi:MAG: zinc-dependent metalloprotease [Desulfobulbaceae bacterium]|nr:zinc-dependent metalloprotease [Desulfobulbaceae bacterium]